jgi:hypothetical protein
MVGYFLIECDVVRLIVSNLRHYHGCYLQGLRKTTKKQAG